MRNRAKCKLCSEIIESFHPTDYVECKCKSIAIMGGSSTYEVRAKDYENFLRVDDEGNTIIVKLQGEHLSEDLSVPTKSDLLSILDDMIKNVESLPIHVMSTPITHYDFCSLMILIKSIMSAKE